jgi:hypothetical protein
VTRRLTTAVTRVTFHRGARGGSVPPRASEAFALYR